MHDHSLAVTCRYLHSAAVAIVEVVQAIPRRRIVDDPISLFHEEIVNVVRSTTPELADPAEQNVDIPVPFLTTRKSW